MWAGAKEKLQIVDPNAQALKDEPTLLHFEQYYMKIFIELSRRRQSGLSIQSIPISEIYNYCEMFGINCVNERSDLLYLIGEMDDELLKFHADKQK